MKRIMACILAAALLLGAACALGEGQSWTCPDCGQTGNTGNFCPNCACPRPAQTAVSSTSAYSARLRMRLSTRSGPGTYFDEPGSFFSKDWQSAAVWVLAKAWDYDNDIWWVLVDFSENGTRYRAWTGLKRVDVNIDLLPEYYGIGQGTVDPTDTWRGPGENYAQGPRITHWQDVVAYGRENGYIEIEYYDSDQDMTYRVWVPENKTSIDYVTSMDY